MDQATTNMCKIGYGRVRFARVLIDLEAEKGLPDKTEIVYKNIDGLVTCKKSVDVNYDWSPPICSFCKVFGHYDKNCVCRPKSVEEFMDMEREELKKKQDSAEFEQVSRKDGTKAGDNKRNEVEKEKMIDKGSPKTGCNVQHDIIDKREVMDVYDDTSGSTRKMAQNDIGLSYVEVLNGMGGGGSNVNNIRNRLFGRWNWYDNALECSRGCIILIGWDNEKIQCMIVYASDQAVLCLFEIQSSKERLFCTFIHAKNSGRLRENMWNDLCNYKSMINNKPWVRMGDLNVSLNLEDDSEGISCMSQDMEEFKDCISAIKMDDICSSGLHYTWIKSLLNPNNSILKMIDRVMGNEEFLED
ncbi:RNA-directed DNA polymerase, eukaryota, reverse transcriptase zinc-binding domain protein [Tanacetum coccineum]